MTPKTDTTSPRRIRKQLLRDAQGHNLEQLTLDVKDQVEMRYNLVHEGLTQSNVDMSPSKIHEISNEISLMNRKDRRRAKIDKVRKARMVRIPIKRG